MLLSTLKGMLKMDNSKTFIYEGSPVTFQIGEATMVNATEMAKPFGKRPAKWLELPSTKDFLSSLSEVRKSDITHLVKTARGNSSSFQQGTWFHEDVALEFARWLSPQFAIWCNDRIKELMKYGVTATPQTIDSVLADPDNAIRLLTALKEERKALKAANKQIAVLEDQKKVYHSENQRLLKLKDKQDKIMLEQAPLVEYAQNVLDSYDTFTSTQIAKELGMSAQALHKFLNDAGVMFRHGSQWFLYAKYQAKGYVKTREHTYQRKDGRTGLFLTTVWTEAGRMFVRRVVQLKRSMTNPPAE
jgi:phage antirepressor YoqD-like protein